MFHMYNKNNEFCEKISIIIQRIVYKYQDEELNITQQDISKLGEKLAEIKNSEFKLLQSNIESIIDLIEPQ